MIYLKIYSELILQESYTGILGYHNFGLQKIPEMITIKLIAVIIYACGFTNLTITTLTILPVIHDEKGWLN